MKSMIKIFTIVKKEIIHAIPSIIYFFVVFNILRFTIGLMLKPDDVRYTSYFGIVLGAILIGKVTLLIDSTPFIDMFPKKPLIYNIIWKTCIYTIATIVLQLVEACVKLIYKYDNSLIVAQHLKHILLFNQFWAVQIMIAIFFLIYVFVKEFARALGDNKFKKMLFGDRPVVKIYGG